MAKQTTHIWETSLDLGDLGEFVAEIAGLIEYSSFVESSTLLSIRALYKGEWIDISGLIDPKRQQSFQIDFEESYEAAIATQIEVSRDRAYDSQKEDQ